MGSTTNRDQRKRREIGTTWIALLQEQSEPRPCTNDLPYATAGNGQRAGRGLLFGTPLLTDSSTGSPFRRLRAECTPRGGAVGSRGRGVSGDLPGAARWTPVVGASRLAREEHRRRSGRKGEARSWRPRHMWRPAVPERSSYRRTGEAEGQGTGSRQRSACRGKG